MFNGLAINPAYAGCQEALNIAALYRSSRLGKSVEGAPVTQTFTGDFPLRNQQLSLGLMVFNDKESIFKHSGAYFAYAYRVNVGKGKISFGLQAGFDLRHEEQGNLTIIENPDPSFDLEIHNKFMPNVGAGAYYHRSNFFAGLSIPHILSYSPKIRTPDSYKSKPSLSNTMINCGMVIPTGIGFKFRPSTMVQFTGRKVLYDLNCNFILLNEHLELGVSWRSSDTVIALAQIQIAQLSIGYAYDHALVKASVINMSHELLLRYNLKIMVKAASPLYY